jgi:hypothetical protein
MDYADYELAASETDEAATLLLPLSPQAGADKSGKRQPVLVVVEDGVGISQMLWDICEFLDVSVVRVPGHCDLSAVLRRQTPMAVVCELDGVAQDGCHVMKTVASHDPSLPILLLTGDDPILSGAADAVEEIWHLSEVTKLEALPGVASVVDFLFHAGRKGGCLRLMPVRG